MHSIGRTEIGYVKPARYGSTGTEFHTDIVGPLRLLSHEGPRGQGLPISIVATCGYS